MRELIGGAGNRLQIHHYKRMCRKEGKSCGHQEGSEDTVTLWIVGEICTGGPGGVTDCSLGERKSTDRYYSWSTQNIPKIKPDSLLIQLS